MGSVRITEPAMSTVVGTSMLLVAKNQLVPLQRPLTFGLVFWGWFLALYLAVALAGALGARLLARLTGQPLLPSVLLALASVIFLGAALGWNRGVLPSLVALAGALPLALVGARLVRAAR